MYRTLFTISFSKLFTRSLFMVLFVLCGLYVSAQSDEVIINNVNFVGNKKTKDRVIIFEMAINEGDTIALDDLNDMIGYVRKYEVKYSYPYLSGGWGLSTNVVYSEQREIGYITEGNKTLFKSLEDERIMLTRFRASASLSKRIGLRFFQSFRFAYHQNGVDQYVVDNLNSEYFLNGATGLRFFQLEYDADYDRRVYTLYPEGGYRLRGNIKKDGFGFEGDYNNLSITGSVEKYWKPWGAFILESRLRAKTNLMRDRISFANNTGLGYGGNIITGYELYLVDGTDWILHKNAIKIPFVDLTTTWNWMKMRQYKKVSLKAWLRWNVDYGYVNERHYNANNPLNNQWLLGYGPALDMLLYNTFSLQLEYSFNEIGEQAFFVKALSSLMENLSVI